MIWLNFCAIIMIIKVMRYDLVMMKIYAPSNPQLRA